MGARFGAYEKTYSIDSEASISVCVRSMRRVSLRHAFHHHISSATLLQGLNVMDLDSYTTTIGFFVGLATSLGCL
jgi:hypothetical protein